MSQMYRDLTRFYFDNIQNPNIEKLIWIMLEKLEACYSRTKTLTKYLGVSMNKNIGNFLLGILLLVFTGFVIAK